MEPRLLLSADLLPGETPDPTAAILTTDKLGYAPGETAVLNASLFQVGETVNLQVVRDGEVYSAWAVTDGSVEDLDGELDGNIETSVILPLDSPGSTFLATASGASSSLSDDTSFEGLITWVQAVPTDYVPGETANIFAGGFQIGESVLFEITNLTNDYVYTPPWSVLDGSEDDLDGLIDGHIQTGWLVPEDALNTTLHVSATGETSGLIAENTFTDSRTINSVMLNGGSSVTVVAGASITAVVNATTDNGGGNNDWQSTGWRISTTAPGTVTVVDHSDHTDSGTFNETFSITAPVIPGTYNAYFIAYGNDTGTGGGASPSATFTLAGSVVVVAPTFTIDDVTTTETDSGTTNFTFSVTLANGLAGDTYSVQYATANGTATIADIDYTAISPAITLGGFSTDNPTQTLTVLVNGDTKVEANETFFVNLTNPLRTAGTGAVPTISDTQGQGTITDNDAATVSITANDGTAAEAAINNGQFTITLTNLSSTDTVVNYSVTGTSTGTTDYTALTGSVTIFAGTLSALINVSGIVDDAIVEGTETVVVTLTGFGAHDPEITLDPDLAARSATVNIADNDSATVTLSGSTTAVEGGSNGSLTATLTLQTSGTGPASLATAISGITLAPNGDYSSSTESFSAGALSGATVNLTVSATDDQLVEGPEAFASAAPLDTISNAVVTEAGTGTVNVTDNDTATVTLSGSTTAVEGGSNGSLTATLSLQTLGTGTASLATAITGITLASNADSSSSTESFSAGAVGGATVNLTVTATDDQLVEGPEAFASAALVDTTSNAAVTEAGTGTVNVTDNDTATVTLSGTADVTEGDTTDTLTATLTLQTSGTGAASLATAITGITLAAANDYSSDTQSFSAGALSGATVNLTVTATDDQLVEGPEAFVSASLVNTTSNAAVTETGTGTVNVTDNDTATVTLSGTADVTEGDTTDTLTATLSLQTSGTGSASLATAITGITLAAANDYSSDTQSFSAGALSGATVNLTVTATDDQLVEGPEAFASASLVNATSNAAVTEAGTGTVNVTDNDTATVTLSGTADVTEGSTTDTLTATLSLQTSGTGPASLATAITGITLAAADDYSSSTESFSAGAVSGATVNLTVTATDDQLVEGPESFASASLVDTTSNAAVTEAGTGTVNVTDNDTATVTLSGTADVTEGSTADTLTATLSLQTSGTGAASLATAITGITLASNADYSSDTQSFSAGALSGATVNLTVTATDDQLVEGPEAFALASLVNTTSNAAVTETGTGTVNVTDNDTATVTLSGIADVTEGGTADTLTATLSLQTSGTGAASLATAITGITLAAANDYSSDTQSFSAGALSGATVNLTVTATNDQLVEGPEAFASASLVNATSNAAVTEAGTGTVNVTDNDTATVTLSGTANVTESGTTDTLTATLTLQTFGTGDASLATAISGITLAANADYSSDTKSFGAGELSGATVSLTVTAANDQLVEGPEAFALASLLDTTSNTSVTEAGSGTVNVTDNDTATVTLSGTADVTEGSTTDTLTATLTLQTFGTGAASLATAITGITLVSNADYNSTSESFGAGAVHGATVNLTVTATDDQLVEGPEAFASASLVNTASNALVTESGTGTVNVTDNDTATVTLSGTADVTEGGTTDTLTATLTLQTSGTGPASLATAISGITLASNADYSSTSESFGAGAVHGGTVNLTVTATNDQLVEGPEAFASASLVNTASNAAMTEAGTGTVNVTDNDTATVTLSGIADVTEGGTADTLTATLSLQTSGTGAASLATAITGITLASNADYSSDTQSFSAGALSGATVDLTVTATDDRLVEGLEAFVSGSLANTTSNAAVTEAGTGTVNVTDNDTATIALQTASSSLGESAGSHNMTAVLTITASGTGTAQLDRVVTANVSDAGSGTATGGGADYTGVTKTLTFGIGSLTGVTQTTSGLLTIVDDRLLEGSETINLTLGGLSDGTGGQVTLVAPTAHTVTLTDNEIATLAIASTSSVTEQGGPQAVGVVTLNITGTGTGTSALGAGISLTADVTNGGGTAISGTDYASFGIQTVVFSGGAASGDTRNATLTVTNDTLVEANETVNLALSNLGGSAVAKSLGNTANITTITDNDTAMYTINNASVTEGGNLSFTVSLSNPVDVETKVNVSFADVSTDAGDFTHTTQQVTFAAGSTTAQVVLVPTTHDLEVELDETLTASLALDASTPLTGYSKNLTDTGTGTIIDNDTDVTVLAASVQYSDRVAFSATIDTGVNANVSGTLNFYIYSAGSWNLYATATVTNQPTPLTVTATSDPVSLAPGSFDYKAEFVSSDSVFTGDVGEGDLTVNKEDARATYTGLMYVTTSSATSSTATVLLSATIQDITAITGSGDMAAGDIRNATVTFVDRDNSNAVIATVPVGLVNVGDTKTGTAHYSWAVDIGNADSVTYHIGVIVDGYYTRNSSYDNTEVTVKKPTAGSIGGGGYLVNTEDSAGLYAGAEDARTNFGLNVKFGKSGKSLQGNVNIIVRASDGHIYQFKSNSIDSLNITSPSAGVTLATFTSKANVKDITDPLHPIDLGGNKLMQIQMTDVGEPGSSDKIAITISDSGGGVLFSGNWDGVRSIEQLLGGGNLQIRPALLLDGAAMAGGDVAAELTPEELQPIVEAAKTLWLSTGLTEEQLQALNDFTVQIDNLTDIELGWEGPGVITIDADAAGYGWFIDSTPFDDVEFADGVAVDPEAIGKVDLLSAVMHEIGHVLGHDHDSSEVMSETIGLGMRVIDESLDTGNLIVEIAPDATQSPSIDWDAELSALASGRRQGWVSGQSGPNFPVFSLEGFNNGEGQSDAKKKRLYEDTSTAAAFDPKAEIEWHVEI